MRIILLLLGFSVVSICAIGQEGSSCTEPILLDSLNNVCSANGAYDLGEQGDSGVPHPTCYPNDSGVKDMWFHFRPNLQNINIVVRGESMLGNENTLRNPQMVVYKGVCDDLEVVSCISDALDYHFVELTVGDLEPGADYYIRVSSRSNHDGRFQLCINNFQFTPDYSSDCPDATILCDKETITVDLLSGTGDIQDEADNTCLDTDPVTGGDDGNSESSSVWFRWVARNDGNLTFTLDPINPVDDLDFAVFELPGGVNDCNNKVVVRCMASGENVGAPFEDWRVCTGATGLREGETSTSEERGCQDGNTNFLAPLEMEEGKAYALVVNNYSQSGSGFRLEWGGSGEFAGPEANIVFLDDKPIYCPDEDIRFYAEDISGSGAITDYNWVYSGTDVSGELTGAGPHAISFPAGGIKPIILNLESDIGCITSLDTFVEVENPIQIDGMIDSISCFGYNDGGIEVQYSSPSTVTSAFWQDGQTEQVRVDLGSGEYTYTVRNERGCSNSATYELVQPLPIEIRQVVSLATCGGGADGSIELNVTGTFDPFEYNFADGQGFTQEHRRENLQAGVYQVSVRDNMGCEEDTVVLLSEIDLDLDPSVIQEPRCFGYSDGSVELNVNGGQGPYEYDFNTTGMFTGNNRFENLTAGSYIVAIRDNDNCLAFEGMTLGQPDSIWLSVDTTHISCFGLEDGRIRIEAQGGTPGYRYNWSHGATTAELVGLSAGPYQLELLDQNDCPAELMITLREPPELSIDLVDKMDVVCFGDSDGFIEVTANGGEGDYMYSLNDGSLSSIPEFDQLSADRYFISVVDGNDCRDSVEVVLTEPEMVEVHITTSSDSIHTIRLGESLDLGSAYTPSDRMMTWSWTPTERVDCSDCPAVVSMPVTDTEFTLTGTDQDGCTGMDELLIRVIPVRDIGVPNVVIPGRGNQNSFVTIYGGPHIARIIEFDVFDRWGNLLFTRENMPPNQFQLGWDGTLNGQRLIPGIYVYKAQVEFIDQVVDVVSGEILVIE